MNYFRYIMLATLFAMPLHAMGSSGPRASFLSRCYGYASSWISSSFLVTREFVRREFGVIRDQLNGFNTKLTTMSTSAREVEENLSAIRKDQMEYRAQFSNFKRRHEGELQVHQEELGKERERHNTLANGIVAVNLATQETGRIVAIASDDLEKLKKSNAEQRHTWQMQEAQTSEQQKNMVAEVKSYFETQDSRFNKAMALLEANRQKIAQFGDDLDKELLLVKQRIAEQKKNSDQLEQLNNRVREQERKVIALAAAFNGFRTAFYAAQLTKANLVTNSVRSLPFPGSNHALLPRARSSETPIASTPAIEPIDE